MAKKTSPSPAGDELDTLIDQYATDQAAARRVADRQTERRERILAVLRKRRKTEWTNPRGVQASIVTSEISTWHIDKLKAALDKARFVALCPPAPNGKALKAILVSDPVLGKRLAKCRDVEESVSLRVEKGKAKPEAD
jgi:hypothetical protein